MLEILLIIAISKKISAMMTAKGRSATGYVLLFVFLWFGGEILGGILGAILATALDPRAMDGDGFMCGAYLFALIGAAIGGTSGYLIAKNASDLNEPHLPEFDDDEDEYGERGNERRRQRRASEHNEGIEEER